MTLKEDAIIEASKALSLHTLNLSNDSLPMRPGYGKAGRSILLKANYFRMTVEGEKSIFRYRVDLRSDRKRNTEESEAIGPRGRHQAFDILLEIPDFQSSATDYTQTIITNRKLDLGTTGQKSYSILYREAEEKIPRRNATRYTFTLSFEGVVPIDNLLHELKSTLAESIDSTAKDETIQALNIIMARTPNNHSEIFQSGKNKFFHYPSSHKDYLHLSGGLIAVRGLYSSVRTSTMRTLLNINSQCSPFYPAINMAQHMKDHSGWQQQQWEALEAFIAKLRVKTQYLKNNGAAEIRIKTVVGLSHRFVRRINPATQQNQQYGNAKGNHGNVEQITFQYNGLPITVAKYFQDSKFCQCFDEQKLI